LANEEFIRQLTTEHAACPDCHGTGRASDGLECATCGGRGTIGTTHRFGSVRNNVFAAVVLTVAGVVLVWLFMFLLAHG
jgi:DnaJ-class molecular chaperone